jgi:hypothetical protein
MPKSVFWLFAMERMSVPTADCGVSGVVFRLACSSSPSHYFIHITMGWDTGFGRVWSWFFGLPFVLRIYS